MIEQAGGTTYKTLTPDRDGDVDEISGGFSITGGLRGADAPTGDATISWWIKATDKTGNVGYTDRAATKDNKDDACPAKTDSDGKDLTGEALIKALAADDACDAYAVHVDDTDPKLERAETGRHWSAGLFTGASKDKTEYRVGKADKSSVLVVFSEGLDASSVSASDFEVNGATPADAAVYNVKVRDDVFDLNPDYDESKDPNGAGTDSDGDAKFINGDGNADIAGDSVQDVGFDRGYVFLTLASDLKAGATPKVALVGEVLDLAGNEQDAGTDNEALDRIAPTLTVTINEGSRPVSKDKLNVTITSDEIIGTPDVTFHEITSKTVGGETTQTVDATGASANVKFVSSTEYTAAISAGNGEDGLYAIYAKATDAAGGNVGAAGDKTADVDLSDDTKAILFELDTDIGDPDVNPDKDDVQDKFETDDANAYIRIDFSAEADEYDDQKDGDDLDTHAGVTIVSAALDGADIKDALQANDAGNVFLYKAPDGLAIGDHDLEIVAQDAAGNKHLSAKKATITITERKPFSLELNPGWNLVSIPGEPANADINTVIPADRTDITSVLSYDPTVAGRWLSAARGADGVFSGTLKNIVSTRAYWMETNSFEPLPVEIPKQRPGQLGVLPTVPVAAGWNMVPVLDIDGDFKLDDDGDDSDKTIPASEYFAGLEGARAYGFNTIANKWEQATALRIGKGYWLYAETAGVIAP